MAKISKDEFISAIAEMTVTEIAELISAMEEKFGVTAAVAAAPAAAGGAAAGGGAAAAEEKTEFTIIIKSSDPAKKIAAIKEVRAITNLGLKEAKDMVEAPNSTVKEGVSKEDAAKFKAALEAAGCVVELK